MKGGIEKLLKKSLDPVDEVVNVGEDLPEMTVETIEEYRSVNFATPSRSMGAR